MAKTMVMFPGQGSQYIGMCRDFYENMEEAREVIDLASSVTGINMTELLFEENDKIHITEYTQIAILSMELAILRVLKKKGFTYDVAAGLSLGEYGALVAAGVLTEETAFRVVKERGRLMQEAYPEGGAMSAVLGMDGEKIAEICKAVDGIVTVANYNCPGQIVISGEKTAVEKAGEALKEAGAKRVIPLKVSGPFHSLLLAEAGSKLKKVLDEVEVSSPKKPYFANVTGDYVTENNRGEEIRILLESQVSSSVCWQQTMEKALADGVDTFVEVGPGHTLTGFLKKMNPEVTMLNIEKWEDLGKVC